MLIITLVIAALTLIERKFLALNQRRVGPYYVGYHGRLQYIADALKLFIKGVVIHDESNKFWFVAVPSICALVCYFFWVNSVWCPSVSIVDIEYNLVYATLLSISFSFCIILLGYFSGNKYTRLASIRCSLIVLNLELFLGLMILTTVVVTESFCFSVFVEYQKFWWLIFTYFGLAGLLCLLFLLEVGRTPFDLAEAESELVTGYSTEIGGFTFGIFYLGEYFHLFFFSAVISIIFLGGWEYPSFLGLNYLTDYNFYEFITPDDFFKSINYSWDLILFFMAYPLFFIENNFIFHIVHNIELYFEIFCFYVLEDILEYFYYQFHVTPENFYSYCTIDEIFYDILSLFFYKFASYIYNLINIEYVLFFYTREYHYFMQYIHDSIDHVLNFSFLDSCGLYIIYIYSSFYDIPSYFCDSLLKFISVFPMSNSIFIFLVVKFDAFENFILFFDNLFCFYYNQFKYNLVIELGVIIYALLDVFNWPYLFINGIYEVFDLCNYIIFRIYLCIIDIPYVYFLLDFVFNKLFFFLFDDSVYNLLADFRFIDPIFLDVNNWPYIVIIGTYEIWDLCEYIFFHIYLYITNISYVYFLFDFFFNKLFFFLFDDSVYNLVADFRFIDPIFLDVNNWPYIVIIGTYEIWDLCEYIFFHIYLYITNISYVYFLFDFFFNKLFFFYFTDLSYTELLSFYFNELLSFFSS